MNELDRFIEDYCEPQVGRRIQFDKGFLPRFLASLTRTEQRDWPAERVEAELKARYPFEGWGRGRHLVGYQFGRAARCMVPFAHVPGVTHNDRHRAGHEPGIEMNDRDDDKPTKGRKARR